MHHHTSCWGGRGPQVRPWWRQIFPLCWSSLIIGAGCHVSMTLQSLKLSWCDALKPGNSVGGQKTCPLSLVKFPLQGRAEQATAAWLDRCMHAVSNTGALGPVGHYWTRERVFCPVCTPGFLLFLWFSVGKKSNCLLSWSLQKDKRLWCRHYIIELSCANSGGGI